MQEITTLSESDQLYPQLLKEIAHAPKKLFVWGEFPDLKDAWTIGIVGTRKPTEYGKSIARDVAAELASGGAIIISGLATGIDREAHVGALQANGKTISVIGSGLDRESFFPQSNWHTAENIVAKGGCVLSEYPVKTPALPGHFPERNRIISGLAQGIIVIEAQERSGALITARLALEQGRDVFAVPGPITSLTSRGPNLLIKEGAVPLLSASDVFEFYGKSPIGKKESSESTEGLEGKILELLAQPMSLDELKTNLSVEMSLIQASLSLLELQNKIRESEPGIYTRRI